MTNAPAGYLLRELQHLLEGRRADTPHALLLARFTAQRDEAAFAALVDRHAPLVWGLCRRLLHCDQDAEDVFQATFIVLARRAGSIRKGRSLGCWLHGVARRLALRVRADAARRRRHESAATRDCMDVHADDLSWRELRGILDEELARLPEKLRAPPAALLLRGANAG